MLSRVARTAVLRSAVVVARRSAARNAACSLTATQPGHLCSGQGCSCVGVRQFSSKGDEKGPKTIRINTLADGADPVELPDSEYPEWLWTITGDRPSESELLDKGLDNLTLEEQTTYLKKSRKRKIKATNDLTRK